MRRSGRTDRVTLVTRLVILLLPVRSPLLEAAHVDGRVVAFTLATSLISAIVFSIVPAFKEQRIYVCSYCARRNW